MNIIAQVYEGVIAEICDGDNVSLFDNVPIGALQDIYEVYLKNEDF